MAKRDPGYRPMVFSEREPESRASASSGVTLADPVLAQWFGAYAETASGLWVTAETARRCPEVDACVGLIEDTLGTVPCELFAREADGSRQAATASPLYGLVHDRPNGWQTSSDFFKLMEGWRQTHGNAYARLITTNRGPVGMEPLYPPSCRPYMTPQGLVYRWTPPDNGPVVTLMADEVLHVRGGPPRMGRMYEAIGKVELHREDIGLVQACSQYLSRFFANNATPRIAIEVPGTLTPESSDTLRQRWMTRHAGVENAHIPAVLEGGMKVSPIGATNDDSQIVQSHAMGVAKLARSWGVPAFLIGETGGVSNFGTGIEQQSIGFVTYYMRPKYVAWEQALDVLLMSSQMRRDFFFSFDMDGLVRGDFKSRMDAIALQIQWGVLSPNEVRRSMNLPPAPGGDERLFPLNMCPASLIKDVLLKGSDPKETKPASAVPVEPTDEEKTRALIRLIQAVNAESRDLRIAA